VPQKPIETTVEFLSNPHQSSPSVSEETANACPSETYEMPYFALPAQPGEIGRLGKYRIQKELGRGGMGAVYLAFDERLQRQVALKVMLPKFATNPTAKDRFLREARAAAQICSDHIVNIYEADEIDGTPYIALQLLQGYPLDDYLKKKGSPSLSQIVRIGREVAIGLAAAHELGLVHRDIKPSNVWLEAPNDRVKILDFGLAKPAEGAEVAELTALGAVVGTPAYMAPEQGRGLTIDGRADLFSLGCVLYRLSTGKPPFARTTLMSILIAIAIEEPTPVRELNPDVPQPLADLIHRLLAKNAADRPADAQAVVKEFDEIIEPTRKSGEGIPHGLDSPMTVSVQHSRELADIDTSMDSETEKSQVDASLSSPRKFPTILVGSLLFALIAIVVAGVIVIKITNKDGTITEVNVPADSKIEVDGKTVASVTKVPEVKIPEVIVKPPKQGPSLPATFKNTLGMEFVRVPNGTAWLGGMAGALGNVKVEIVADFHLGKYEVTQGEWQAVMGKNPSHFTFAVLGKDQLKGVNVNDVPRLPVDSVSWDDCQAFIAKLNDKVKETGFTYRLPTDAEWEYACRGGSVTRDASGFDYCFTYPGNGITSKQANCNGDGTLKRTSVVGSYPPNPFGLHDMHGNVWEWCDDDGRIEDGIPHKIHRGGGWYNDARHCRASSRDYSPADMRLQGIGLRLARVSVDGLVTRVDRDRQAAEWLFARGANFGYTNLSGYHYVVVAKTPTFPAGEFKLDNFRLVGKFADRDLARFQGLNRLDTISLNDTDVADAGLESLVELPKLEKLYLEGTKITDASLKRLAGAKTLKLLQLNRTKISDDGLKQLHGLSALAEIQLHKTAVTAAGVQALAEALPKCKIESDFGKLK